MHGAATTLPITILGGVSMLALAAFLLVLDAKRTTNRVFAAFLTWRGISNLDLMAYGHSTALLAFRLDAFVEPGIVFATLALPLVFPRRRPILDRAPWLLVVPFAAAVLVGVATLVDLSLFREATQGADGLVRGPNGPLAVLTSLQLVAFVVVGTWFLWQHRREGPGPYRAGLVLVGTGLVVTGAFAASISVVQDVLGPLRLSPGGTRRLGEMLVQASLPIAFLAGALLVGALRRAPPHERGAARFAFAALAGALVSGALVGFLLSGDGTRAVGAAIVSTVSAVWRFLFPVFVAYGVVHHQIVDIDVRVKGALRHAPVVALPVAALLVVALVAAPFTGPGVGWTAGAAAGAAVLAAAAPLRRLGSRVADAAMPHVEASPDYLAMRKLEVYRAALEESAARGSGDETEEQILSELRRTLGITSDVHRAMVVMLKSERAQRKGELTQATRTRFRIERELGRGGFGRVLLAHDTGLDRRVVLKQPVGLFAQDENSRALFLKEARLAARIQHPNVVAVHDVLEAEEPPMLVLEYVAGGSLEDRLRKGKLSDDETVRLAGQVLAGLDRIHREGIVHRDIKPGNILLAQDGAAKITDFGIAHAKDPGASAVVTVAGTGFQPGSVAYMSPEQARGDPVDARSDLYSLAVVLHEASAGRHPLAPLDAAGLGLRGRIQSESPDLSAVAEPLRSVLARALAKDPAARYGSAAEMAAALAAGEAAETPRPAGGGAGAPA